MRQADLEEVVLLESQVQDFPWGLEHFIDSLAQGHKAWILRQGIELVGFVIVMSVLDEAHLLNIAIAPTHQGKGFGGRLLRHAMLRSSEQGAQTMYLEVRISNLRAEALYRHFGFRNVGQRKAYYPAPEGREDALVFSRNIEDIAP